MERDLEEGKEKNWETISMLRKPYLAALGGQWDVMKSFFEKNRAQLCSQMTVEEDTAFHIAAYSEEKELLQHLVNLLPASSSLFEALNMKNTHGNNTFHEVATTDGVETAKFLVKKLQEVYRPDEGKLEDLLKAENKLGETPIYRAVAHGQTKMAKYLATKVGDLSSHFRRKDDMSILHIAVIGQHFDTAIWLLSKDKKLAEKKEQNGLTCLHLLAKMPHVFGSYSEFSHMGKLKKFLYYCLPSQFEDDDVSDDGNEAQIPSGILIKRYRAMWRAIAKGWPAIDKLWKMKRTHSSASELTESLVKADYTWKAFPRELNNEDKTISLVKVDTSIELVREQGQTSGTKEVGGEGTSKGQPSERNHQKSYHPLLEAASNGIVEIFDKMIESYPQVIEYISNDEENILHVAIGHRQRDIYRRVKKMEVIMKCRLVSQIDKNGDTLLHHVALGKTHHGRESKIQAAGPAFQLQEELSWLKHVRKIIPSHYIMHCNNKGKTADELFQDTHADLLKLAQQWIKETSQSCSAVSVLVATVVFAAAYTVPGGNDASGRPNFIDSPFFVLFTIMDVISLACSLTSVVMFLSILSSPFEYENFKASLPRKLIIGFTLLFFSVTTTMLSFAATIFLLLHFQKKAWTKTLIYTAAFLPVSMFALMQFPLYAAFNKLLRTLTNKIEKKVYPQKFLPPYLRTKKLNKLS
nr:isoform 2 of ankyrin repeat-containing protein npr4 [Quercus suber]